VPGYQPGALTTLSLIRAKTLWISHHNASVSYAHFYLSSFNMSLSHRVPNCTTESKFTNHTSSNSTNHTCFAACTQDACSCSHSGEAITITANASCGCSCTLQARLFCSAANCSCTADGNPQTHSPFGYLCGCSCSPSPRAALVSTIKRMGSSPFYLWFTQASLTSRAVHPQQYHGAHVITLSGHNFCYLASSSLCDNRYRCQVHDPANPDRIATARACVLGSNAGAPCEHDADCASDKCSDIISVVSTPARVINSSAVSCVVPAWHYADADAWVMLFDVSFNSRILPVGSVGTPSSVLFREAIDVYELSAVASSGDKLILDRKYSPVEDYACKMVRIPCFD